MLQHFWFLLGSCQSCILFLHWLSWLRPFVFLFSSCRQLLGLCLALDENIFLYSILNITTTSSFEPFSISSFCHSTKWRYVLKTALHLPQKQINCRVYCSKVSAKQPTLVLHTLFSPFALTPLANLQNLLICAPIFSLSCFLAAWFLFINAHYFLWKYNS